MITNILTFKNIPSNTEQKKLLLLHPNLLTRSVVQLMVHVTPTDIHCTCMCNSMLSLPQLIVYHDIWREYENGELSKASILTLQSMR